MKKIAIDSLSRANRASIQSRDHSHLICLGNGVNAYITGIVKAREFLADTNRFLNEKIHEINEVYIEVLAVYNRSWFVLDTDTDRRIQEDIRSFPKSRRLAIERSSWENGNNFTFVHLYKCLDTLDSVLDHLIRFNKRYKRYPENYYLKTMRSRIEFIQDQINKHGQEFHKK